MFVGEESCVDLFIISIVFIIFYFFCLVAVFQTSLEENRELIDGIAGFEDSVRKCELRH